MASPVDEQILAVLQQVVVELKRLQQISWIIAGKPKRNGFDDVPPVPPTIPEVPLPLP